MAAFVFVLLIPGIMLGMIARNKQIMGSLASNSAWSIVYWISLALVLASGIVALAAFI
jgi:hypothetical protein